MNMRALGERWDIEVTVESFDGADSARDSVRAVIEATGWLFVEQASSWLLPGEHAAWVTGERPVVSVVNVVVELAAVPFTHDTGSEILANVYATASRLGARVHAASVAYIPVRGDTGSTATP